MSDPLPNKVVQIVNVLLVTVINMTNSLDEKKNHEALMKICYSIL